MAQASGQADTIPGVWFELDLGDGKGYQKISLDVLDKLGPIYEEELTKLLQQAAERLEYSIRNEYDIRMASMGGTSDRESIKDRIFAAIYSAVELIKGDSVDMGVFDLGKAITDTSRPEDNPTGGRSVFEILEDGYRPSQAYGFMPHDYAVELARQAALSHHWSQERTEVFVERVDTAFRGKTGEGIMIDCFSPLFHEFPATDSNDPEKFFGDPYDFGIIPHSGWQGYNVLRDMPGMLGAIGSDTGEFHWLDAVMDQTAKNAAARLRREMQT